METYMVFLSLPSSQTISIRGLERTVPIEFLQARIELEVGLPCNAYELHFGKTAWKGSDIQLDFTRNVRNGAMIRIVPGALWETLYLTVRTGKVKKVLTECAKVHTVSPNHRPDGIETVSFLSDKGEEEEEEEEEEAENVTQEDKLFFSLCAACCIGATKLVYSLLKLDESLELVHMKTPFGRSPFHMAAANDKLAVLELLGADAQPKDMVDLFGQTPTDIAKECGAMAAQRVIKNLNKNPKRMKARRKLTARLEERRQNSGNLGVGASRAKRIEDALRGGGDAGDAASPAIRISYLKRGERSPERGTPAEGIWVSSSRASSARLSNPSSPSRISAHGAIMVSPIARHPPPAASKEAGGGKTGNSSRTIYPKKYEDKARIQLFKQSNVAVEPRECPSVPCSSPGGSLEDLTNVVMNQDTLPRRTTPQDQQQTKEEVMTRKKQLSKAYTRPKQTTYRVQSAGYYRTQYHQDSIDGAVPQPRPRTAGPRYRQWKTWLLDKMEDDELKAQQLETDAGRIRQNAAAYRQWLRAKQREEDEESEEESDDDPYAYAYPEKETGITFDKWLELRKGAIAKLDAKTKREKANKGKEKRRTAYDDRRMTIFEFGNVDAGEVRKQDPNTNMRAFQRWQEKKTKYDIWKERNGVVNEGAAKRGTQTRSALILDGMTYDEWLGEKFG